MLKVSIRYKVVTTVRSDDKGDKLLNAHAPWSKNNLSYTIVKDVTQKGAFDEVCIPVLQLVYAISLAKSNLSSGHQNHT